MFECILGSLDVEMLKFFNGCNFKIPNWPPSLLMGKWKHSFSGHLHHNSFIVNAQACIGTLYESLPMDIANPTQYKIVS